MTNPVPLKPTASSPRDAVLPYVEHVLTQLTTPHPDTNVTRIANLIIAAVATSFGADLATAVGVKPAAWSWTPPAEPGPEVRRVRPVENYPGDNSIWFDREPDGSGWRLVMRGRAGGVIEWLQVVAAAGSVYGGRELVDATAERQNEGVARA